MALPRPAPQPWRPPWRGPWRRALAVAAAALAAWLAPAGPQPGWTAAQAQPAAASAPAPLLMVEQTAHSAPVRRIDVQVQRNLAVTASDDRTARVWDLASGELLQVLRPLAFGAEGGRLYGAAIHPTLPLVVVGGTTGGEGQPHRLYFFDLDSGALLRQADARGGDVRKLAWSADGSLLLAAYAGQNGLRAFDTEGRLVFEDALGGPAFGLATSRSGLAAVVSLDGQVRSYRAAAGQVSALARAATPGRRAAGVAFSPDGQQLAVAYADAGVDAEVFDAAGLQSQGRLPVPKVAAGELFGGDFRVVAWSADGRSIHLGGTAYQRDGSFVIADYDAASRRLRRQSAVARDSVTDLVALPAGELAFSSFDGSWGRLLDGQVTLRVASRSSYIRVPEDLELSADGLSARWGMKSTPATQAFRFAQRRLQGAAAPALRAPELRFGVFDAPSDWAQARGTPIVGGKALPMGADERPRALSVVRATRQAALGSNRALYLLDDKGDLRWRTPVDTEIRGVNTSEDGRWVVAALADGTLRWYRGRDGALQLTLLTHADGRWVLWTPSGYFDASAGADRLVGVAVPAARQPTMEFHSLNRFRDRFNRPDLIDALLQTQDERAAFELLASRDAAAQEAAVRESRAREQEAQAAARAAQQAAEQAREAERREAEARALAEQLARDTQARLEASRRAEAERLAAQEKLAQERAAQQQAEAQRAAQQQAEQQRLQRERDAKQAEQQAQRQQAERLAALQAEQARAEQQRAEQRRAEQLRAEQLRAEQERAEREAAARLAEARDTQAREAAARDAAQEAERLKARAQAARDTAARLAQAQEQAARDAAREAEERARLLRAREAFASIRAIEFPPALFSPEARRIKASTPEVTLPFALSSSSAAGAVEVELRVNGRPAQPRELVLPASPDGAARGFAKLPVAEGETVVDIIARNRYGASEPLSFRIERAVAALATPPARGPAGDLYVLAIGVSEFQRPEYKLNLPAKDATDFARAMQAQEGKQYRRVVVRTLTNRDATRSAITREFEWLRQSVGPADTAMLFMAGHGLNDAGGQYFFVPHEGQHDRLLATAVAQSTIVSTLSKIRGRTVFFIDTCFAGNALGALRSTRRQTERMMNDLSASENGVVVFASSTGQEESEENDAWGNGAFTKVLLEGLAGKADFTRAGRVTYAALNLFLSEEVVKLTDGRQRPVFISPRGVPDFALARQ